MIMCLLYYCERIRTLFNGKALAGCEWMREERRQRTAAEAEVGSAIFSGMQTGFALGGEGEKRSQERLQFHHPPSSSQIASTK